MIDARPRRRNPSEVILRAWRGIRLHKDIGEVARQKLWRLPPGDTVRYRLRRGPTLVVESGRHDLWVVNEIWLDRVYATSEQLIPRPGWLVFDIGAHKGVFSAWAASQMGHGTIHAFEPQPRNFPFLERNTAQFSDVAFTLHRSAVGPREGELELFLTPDDSGHASMYRERESFGRAISVPCVSFADAVASVDRRIDLLKMDTEGAEHWILAESPREAFEPIERIVLEYHQRSPRDTTPAEDLTARLEELGFAVSLAAERQLLYGVRRAR